MGDYYGVRMRGVVKLEFVGTWNRILGRRASTWSWTHEASIKHPVDDIVQYAKLDRADFIPWGEIAYQPEDW